ncbi:MAG: transcription-repair coupling factor, partial [Muribaculaceae bacterium]|nr:transcription-repair coupling factor [Muribaculaceae bacterium]
MTLEEADLLFATPARIAELTAKTDDKLIRRVLLRGLPGSAPAMLFARLPKRRIPWLIVTDDPDSAGYLYHDLCQICGDEAQTAIFPSGYKRHIKYGQPDPPAQILRTEALDAIRNSKTLRWIVTSPEALAEKVPVSRTLDDMTLTIVSGRKRQMGELLTRLRELGFKEVDYVYEPGQFARRGSILDVFSYSNEYPYRIDFFDEEIDSIRLFNVETQLSMERLEEVSVIPAAAAETSDGISLIEFLRALHPKAERAPGGEEPVILCQSSSLVLDRVKAITSDTFSESALIADEGDPLAMQKSVDYARFADAFEGSKIVDFGYGGVPRNALPDAGKVAELNYSCSLQSLYHKNFNLISESFTRLIDEGYRIFILSDSDFQTTRLKDIFEERGDRIEFTPVSRTIHEGFADNDARLCFFTDHQIFDRFHKYSLRSDKARSGKLALSLKELNQIEAGDYIVHVDHGIGRFGGLIKTDVNGRPQEMIKLLFQNDDIILVSIHALHKLSKYRGKEGVPPKISKLGTGAWQRIKERTKQKMKDMARDLIRLYAARRQEQGFSYSPDSYLQHELEASFVYEDTPDQLKAMADIKADMESARPMDRLVCGDVGFGKTEIAIRAAFKAATDSKQTAVLVPTTVLAMQHYRTFS